MENGNEVKIGEGTYIVERSFTPGKSVKDLLVQRLISEKKKDDAKKKAGRKILCKRFSTKSRVALESRADSGLNPLITESHGGQNGMRAGTA